MKDRATIPIEQLLLKEGNQLKEQGKTAQAIEKYVSALEANSDYFPVLNQLSAVYENSEEFEEAIIYLKRAVELKPNHALIKARLGRSLMKKGDLDEAIKFYQEAIAIDPQIPSWVGILLEKVKEQNKLENEPKLAKSFQRKPTKANSLQFLKDSGLLPKTIIDVGVQYETRELRSIFPDSKHVLIEPVEQYREKIIENYSAIQQKEFIWAAASSQPGKLFLSLIKRDSETTTHSQLSDNYSSNAGYEVDVITIDNLCQEKKYEQPYLLKIDIDGKDLEVLKGAEETLKSTSCVVIEAPIQTILERTQYLVEQGFVLWDIIDFCYYHGNLSQVDLIFIRRDIKKNNPNLNPWAYFEFKRDDWECFNKHLHTI